MVTPDAFSVSPKLLGAPLATPRRRLAAIVLDLMLVGLLEALSWRLLLGGAVLGLFLLMVRKPDAGRLRRAVNGFAAAGLAAATVFVTFLPTLVRHEGPSIRVTTDDGVVSVGAPGAEASLTAGASDSAAAEVAGIAESDAIARPDSAAAASPSELTLFLTRAAAVAESVSAAQESPESLAAAASASAAPEPPSTAIAWLRDIADEAGLIFGWGTIYLTLFTALWSGRTPGKRVMDLRVVRLTGEPLGLFRSFERAGGYAAGFATGLLGFARVWWDPNRQAIHDKIAETVVVRESLRRGRG